MKLYLGCSLPPFHQQHVDVMGNPNEWVWVDLYVDHPDIKKWNALRLEEVPDESVEAIYSSHLLEHVGVREVKSTLKLWYSKLVPGGEIILNVPDFEWACAEFLRVYTDEKKNIQRKGYYNRSLEYKPDSHSFMDIFYGNQEHEGEYHKSAYTSTSLHTLLEEVGFTAIHIQSQFEAHDMQCLIARGRK